MCVRRPVNNTPQEGSRSQLQDVVRSADFRLPQIIQVFRNIMLIKKGIKMTKRNAKKWLGQKNSGSPVWGHDVLKPDSPAFQIFAAWQL